MTKTSKALSLAVVATLALALTSPAMAAPARVDGPVTVVQRVVDWARSAVASVAGIFGAKNVTINVQDDDLNPMGIQIEPNGMAVNEDDPPLDGGGFVIEPNGMTVIQDDPPLERGLFSIEPGG